MPRRELLAVMRLDQGEGLADAGEHAEAEHIDLQQAERIEIVLVPFDEGAVLHGGVADGDDLRERPARQHEAADMLGEMAGEADQLLRQLEAGREQRIFGIEPGLADIFIGQPRIAQAPDGGGERGDSVLGEAERLPHLAHRRAPAIGDDGRGNPGAVAAVAGIDILDHLLAPLMLEIDVDVGRLLALGRDEALEQKIDLGRIDIGDGEAIADGRVGGRAAALAEDAEPARIVHDVVHGEEIGRVVELLDQSELLLQACRAPSRGCRRGSATGRPPRSGRQDAIAASCPRAPARRDIRNGARRARRCRLRAISMVRSSASSWPLNRRAISCAGFRCRSALASRRKPAS